MDLGVTQFIKKDYIPQHEIQPELQPKAKPKLQPKLQPEIQPELEHELQLTDRRVYNHNHQKHF